MSQLNAVEDPTQFCDDPCETRRKLDFHIELSLLNRSRLEPTLPGVLTPESIAECHASERRENQFMFTELGKISALATEAPATPSEFGEWFDELRHNGPGQYDPLFDYLAEEATYEELRWFIRQEVAGEAGFEDLVAMVQLKMPQQAKLELARNYWDEMGHGKPAGMHGPLLCRVAEVLNVQQTPLEDTVWESLALANLMVAVTYNRRFAYHGLGALGAIELTAPTRAVKVVEALERLGVDRDASHYFRLHATVDIRHWRGWRDNIVEPIVKQSPHVVQAMAEGALLRLNAGARTFDRYRREFGLCAPLAELQ